MLHSSAMSPGLREGPADDDIEVGEIFDVDVLQIDTERDRITVCDLPGRGLVMMGAVVIADSRRAAWDLCRWAGQGRTRDECRR